MLLIETLAGAKSVLAISYDQDEAKKHTATVGGQKVSWTGYAAHVPLGRVAK